MKYIIFCFLFLGSCTKKFIQKPQEIAGKASLQQENNVLYITDELQKLDVYGPLLWFSIIIGSVMLLALSSKLFKNE